jgi:hypothetical protein
MADSILRSEGCMPLTFPDYQEVAPAIGMLAVPEVLENTNASPVCTSVTDMLE